MDDIWNHRCFIYVKPHIVNLYNLRDRIQVLVQKHEFIPQNFINDYVIYYDNFAKVFFSKKTRRCVAKNRIKLDAIYEKMLRTKEKILQHLEEISNLNVLIKIIKYKLINNYTEFLLIGLDKANQFLIDMEKYYGF